MATGTPLTPTDTAAPLNYAPPPTTCPGLPAWAIRWVMVAVLVHGIADHFGAYLLMGPLLYSQWSLNAWSDWRFALTWLPLRMPMLVVCLAVLALIWPVRAIVLLVATAHLVWLAADEAVSIDSYLFASRRGLLEAHGYWHHTAMRWSWPLAVFPLLLWFLGGRSSSRYIAVTWWCSLVGVCCAVALMGWDSMTYDGVAIKVWGYGAVFGVGVTTVVLVIRGVIRRPRHYLPLILCTSYMPLVWPLAATETPSPAGEWRTFIVVLLSQLTTWAVLLSALLVARRLDRPSPVSA